MLVIYWQMKILEMIFFHLGSYQNQEKTQLTSVLTQFQSVARNSALATCELIF